MKLYASTRSPYVRKVLITLHELGMYDDVDIEYVIVGPLGIHPELMKVNPLGKIPTLVTDTGETLFDSDVICDYLDTIYNDSRLGKPQGNSHQRWEIARLRALADGIMSNDIFWLVERNKPATTQTPELIDACREKITTCLDALETGKFQLNIDLFTSGEIALFSALDHLQFRFHDEEWLKNRPNLESWHTHLCERPSLASTAYIDG